VTEVAWITSAYPWAEEPIGGIFIQTQARALTRHGVGVTVISPTPWAPWPLDRVSAKWGRYHRVPSRADDDGVTVLRPRYPNVPGQPDIARADRLLATAALRTRRSWSSADLLHGHYSMQGLATWRVARRVRCPYVLTFHGSDLNSWPDRHRSRLADLGRAMREAAAVLAVSPALADRAEEISGAPARHLPIGSDLATLRANAMPREEARGLLDLPAEAVIVLFVGAVDPEKGIGELVDAILTLDRSFMAVIVGRGPLVGQGLDRPEAAGRLIYTGQRPNADVARFMSAADLFVLPSYSEGTPTVLVEAGAVGLPIVASGVGGIPDMLGTDRGLILPEISARAVADAVLSCVDDRSAALARAERMRAYVDKQHDANTNAALLAEVYASALASAGG
jgi:teichuronic acid biosynthesis glycosyltransferase TuaC